MSVVVHFSGKVLPAKNGGQYHQVSLCSIFVFRRFLDMYYFLTIPIKQSPTFRHFLGFNDAFGAQIPSECSSLTIQLFCLIATPPFLLIRKEIRVRCLHLYYRWVFTIKSPHIAVLCANRTKFYRNIFESIATLTELRCVTISFLTAINIPLLPMQPLSPPQGKVGNAKSRFYSWLIMFKFPILANIVFSISGLFFKPAHRFCKWLRRRDIVFAIEASRLSCAFHYCHNCSSFFLQNILPYKSDRGLWSESISFNYKEITFYVISYSVIIRFHIYSSSNSSLKVPT